MPGGSWLNDQLGWDGQFARNWPNARTQQGGYDTAWYRIFFDLGTVLPGAGGGSGLIRCFTVGHVGNGAPGGVGAGRSAYDSLSPEIRANVDDTIRRAASGKIRFTKHDGKVYDNRNNLLPNGIYTMWTAAAASEKRGAHRVIIEGNPANPNAIYYWDHVLPPIRIGP